MRALLRHVGVLSVAGALVLWAGGVGPHAQGAGTGFRAIGSRSSADAQAVSAAVSQLASDHVLRLVDASVDEQLSGHTHERLAQVHRGVRVFGGDVRRQVVGGQVTSVFGTVYDGIDIDVAPLVSPLDARDEILRRSGQDSRDLAVPELVVLPQPAGGFVLTYLAQAWTPTGLTMFFIDARTGALAWQYNNTQTQSAVRAGRGVLGDDKKVSMQGVGADFVARDLLRPPTVRTYDMQGNLARTKLVRSGSVVLTDADLAHSAASVWIDGASVDAQTYAGWTYDYYFKRFNRRGLNNQDLPITSLVHPADRSTVFTASSADYGLYYVNAFWDSLRLLMVYGDGLPTGVTAGGQTYTYFSGALDVVAHELTHGVTSFTSNLIYLNESGALNEAFSDIMGTSVEFYYQPIRGRANYLISEDIVSLGGFRSMADPQLHGDPDHYSRRYIGTADNGGVHSNSGIANHAFFLAIEGGKNKTSGLTVTGVGAASRDVMEKVFYRAFTQLLPASATFTLARQATIQAARDLYGASSDAERAVTQAWTAVGVN